MADSEKQSTLMAVVFPAVMTLPAVGMIIDGFTFGRFWIAYFGLGLYAIVFCFYIVTAYLVFGHTE